MNRKGRSFVSYSLHWNSFQGKIPSLLRQQISEELLRMIAEREIASLPESCYTASIPDMTGVAVVEKV
jgi:hypothetical protein